jgi:hypothetical protein
MVQVESVGTFRMPGEKAAWRRFFSGVASTGLIQLSGRFKISSA